MRSAVRRGTPAPIAEVGSRARADHVKPMRFATQSGGASTAEEWIARAKRIEALGYDTLAMPDHTVGGAWAAMPALAALVPATTRLRLGTLVMDNDFRNPVVFAREAAVLDVLSGGRFELGVGAGWLDRDYAGTGIPMDPGRMRVARLAEAVRLMKRLFTEEQVDFAGTYYRVEKAECRPKTVQRPHPPILIAGGGREILTLAAREADIVAIVPEGISGSGKLAKEAVTLDTMTQQVAHVREAAGARFDEVELSMFLDCTLTEDRERTIAEMARKADVDPALLADSAYRGIGTLGEIRAHITKVRDAIGVTYVCLRGPDVLSLGSVVSSLSGR